ncbi:MAG: transporter substrate-binding domain-containing protein [Rhodospirillaceae bacterium]|jgi:ABC-type amino acid transport substrate-binding protein|nr:transporter substrate-binding domain-containing protein [Rhodospirillales bacterium]MBT3906082.1 transporter substrate-binding domain-containing protein [Rhodospirillaceae bacterium]MBT5033253.1 transporter substrate-binding domain-containing protein [Rhodospirillaceae bacterium]MBT6218975.1 transporter substrate-binding domain-containing protein [Rhodospirillaceae bacterium]MBT7485277.1 transporter substrate-binding domain-containing protein [Rhodospirillales bacterium]
MLKRTTSCILIAALFWFISTPAKAEEKLTVAVIDLFPFGKIDRSGLQSGLYVDIASALEEELQFPIKKHVLPFKRAFRNILAGKMDLFISFKRDDLASKLKYLGSIGCTKMLMVSSKRTSILSLSDLTGKRVGFVQGASTGPIYEKKFKVLPLYFPSTTPLINLLMLNRFDAFMVNSIVFNSYHHNKYGNVKLSANWRDYLGSVLTTRVHDIHISISRKSKNFKRAGDIEKAISALQRTNKFKESFRRWGSVDGGNCEGLH